MNRVSKAYRSALLVAALCVCCLGMAAADPYEAIENAVANSGVFPEGTAVSNIEIVGADVLVELSTEAITPDFGDTLSDSMVKAIVGALASYPEFKNIEVQVGGQPLWAYLNRTDVTYEPGSVPSSVPAAPRLVGAAQDPQSAPNIVAQSSELAGKLVVLHPSHGSYAYNTSANPSAMTWYRAMRTYCGPNPVTGMPLPGRSTYQPSDHYFYTRGFQWPMYYEDDMSPEVIRFLYAYCKAAGAAAYSSRNLDKFAGDYPATSYGYPAPAFSLPKWQVATKYHLQDLGTVPATVWDTTNVVTQSDKDLRARGYYTNWLMETLGYNHTNTVSFSLHSNAATTGNPPQSQARGTETYWYATQYPTEQAQSQAYATAVESAVITAIRSHYDGKWAEPMYDAVATPVPPEWWTSYGTYRGYVQEGVTNNRWQDRGVKTSNFGEIRECKCPAQLMELLFHDNWKFYPDQAFHQDAIFRSTVAWGMYTGICNFFGVTAKPRNAAVVESVNFPTIVQPGESFSGTVTMKNQGMAWCWGNKMVGTSYVPYTVWNLKATNADQFGKAGTKLYLANDGYYYPGDTATFSVNLTAPTKGGFYNTVWRMSRDGFGGANFGSTATATIGVDAPYFTAVQNSASVLTGSSAATSPVSVRGDVLITVSPSPAMAFAASDPVQVAIDGVTTGPVTLSGADYVCTAAIDGATANGAHQITVTVREADDTVTTLTDWIFVNKNQIVGTVTIPGFVGTTRDVAFSLDGAAPVTKTLTFAGGVAGYTLVNLPDAAGTLSAKTAWTNRKRQTASLSDPVDFTLPLGDINGSNSINVADYNILIANMNKVNAAADLNGDGIVNSTDHALMRSNWLKVGDPQ